MKDFIKDKTQQSPEVTHPPNVKISVGSADLVIVANRLPVDSVFDAQGTIIYQRSPGGLVTALEPLLVENTGAWVGWDGSGEEEIPGTCTQFTHNGITLVPVPLTSQEVSDYYEGFSNATLWPLYHDAVEPARFQTSWWHSYELVNYKFAIAAAQVAAPDATVWIHDYQLQLVPQLLRGLRPDIKIGFFLHIPFPSESLFLQLPSRVFLIEGILGADLIGFQLERDVNNFLDVIRKLSQHPNGKFPQYIQITTTGVHMGDRHVTVKAFPISIASKKIHQQACSPHIQSEAAQLREKLGNPEKILLGLDRLDYTKGIDVRLYALQELLEEDRIDPADIIFIQIAVPSRENIESYRKIRDKIELLVTHINQNWGTKDRPIVHYIHNTIPYESLLKYFVAADIMLVTSFKDGMNLVAKEYIASRKDNTGALILSEFAGAAEELNSAYLINPHDIHNVKEAIDIALHQSPDEEKIRIQNMLEQVLHHDVHIWAQKFLGKLETDQYK